MIQGEHIADSPGRDKISTIEIDGLIAEHLDQIVGMRREHQNSGLLNEVLETAVRTLDERGIADPYPLIHQDDLRIEGGRHRKGETQIHAARIGSHRPVQLRPFETAEFRDFVAARAYFFGCEAEKQAPQHDIVPAGSLRIHAEINIEQAGRDPDATDTTAVRIKRAGKDAQETCLAGSIGADNSDAIAVSYLEIDALQCLNAPRLVARDASACHAADDRVF